MIGCVDLWCIYLSNVSYELKHVLGGGFQHLLFLALPEEMIQFDDHIFQLGWNHQLV